MEQEYKVENIVLIEASLHLLLNKQAGECIS